MIEAFRERARFRPTVRMLADDMGVPYDTVADWKYGKSRLPRPAHLEAIAKMIDVDYDAVLWAALRDAGYDKKYNDDVFNGDVEEATLHPGGTGSHGAAKRGRGSRGQPGREPGRVDSGRGRRA